MHYIGRVDSPKRFFPALIIVTSLLLVAIVAWVLVVPAQVKLLPWAGFLAGLVAVLQALNLKASAPIRWALAVAGLGAMAFMVYVTGVIP